MPIYEYQCQSCDRGFEELVQQNRNAKMACPHCGSKDTERTVSTFAAGQSGAAGQSNTTGQSGADHASSGDMPMCGRCGDFGPCGGG